MTDLEILRIKDEQRVWIGHGDSGAFLHDLPFQCHLNRGGYLSVFHKERRGAVFPNEVFAVDGILYYFGPHPLPYQPIRTCRLNWLGQSPADTPRPIVYPEYGLATSSVANISCGIIAGSLRDIFLKTQEKIVAQSTTSKRWIIWIAVSLLSLPLAAQAPGPKTAEQMDHLRRVALHHELAAMRLEADRLFIQTQTTTSDNGVKVPSPRPTYRERSSVRSHRRAGSKARACSEAFRAAHLLSEERLYALRRDCDKMSEKGSP